MSLEQLNAANQDTARALLQQCCSSDAWVERLLAARPFNSPEELGAAADSAWQDLAAPDYLQAFAGHPKIGDVNSLNARYCHSKRLAAGEQLSVAHASDAVIAALAQANTRYEDRFGFIFIVCATGKSAQQMLDLLLARLPNRRDEELVTAAEEQRKIFQLRLEKLL